MPSGTYYAEVPSTVLNAAGTVDGHALDLLPEMVERYAKTTADRGGPTADARGDRKPTDRAKAVESK